MATVAAPGSWVDQDDVRRPAGEVLAGEAFVTESLASNRHEHVGAAGIADGVNAVQAMFRVSLEAAGLLSAPAADLEQVHEELLALADQVRALELDLQWVREPAPASSRGDEHAFALTPVGSRCRYAGLGEHDLPGQPRRRPQASGDRGKLRRQRRASDATGARPPSPLSR